MLRTYHVALRLGSHWTAQRSHVVDPLGSMGDPTGSRTPVGSGARRFYIRLGLSLVDRSFVLKLKLYSYCILSNILESIRL